MRDRPNLVPFLRRAAAQVVLGWLLVGRVLAAVAPSTEVPVAAIHASGAAAQQVFVVRGGVTRVGGDGFFLQQPNAASDPPAADAIFVRTGRRPPLNPGDCVRVRGRVAIVDGDGPATPPMRTLRAIDRVQVVHGACAIVPLELDLPAVDPGRFEGRLVHLRGPWMVQRNASLARFGELTIATAGRVEVPTNRLRPGPAAQALARANARRSVVLDDGDDRQDPSPPPFLGADGTVRAGDTLPAITGIVVRARLPAGPGGWRILPAQESVRFARANPRPAAPPVVGGSLRVASVNVDNFFATIADGVARCGPRRDPADCRGAHGRAEFERQRAKLVAALLALDADVLALMEIENDGDRTLQSLVDALDAGARAGVYAGLPEPPDGSGSDAIKVAMIYKPARVLAVGAARGDAAAIHGRRPIAQTFAQVASDGGAGRRFNLVAVHLKSRRCQDATGAEADQGDLQGCWSRRRLLQARAVREFAQRVAAASGTADTLVVGDFNAYAQEDALLELSDHGFADQAARLDPGGYTFAFDGAAGRLDQVFASASLAPRVTGVAEWHINADEPTLLDAAHVGARGAVTPYRASDHDPVLIGLELAR